jgi:hypothetical protein
MVFRAFDFKAAEASVVCCVWKKPLKILLQSVLNKSMKKPGKCDKF